MTGAQVLRPGRAAPILSRAWGWPRAGRGYRSPPKPVADDTGVLADRVLGDEPHAVLGGQRLRRRRMALTRTRLLARRVRLARDVRVVTTSRARVPLRSI